jgi:hypothetical protein
MTIETEAAALTAYLAKLESTMTIEEVNVAADALMAEMPVEAQAEFMRYCEKPGNIYLGMSKGDILNEAMVTYLGFC